MFIVVDLQEFAFSIQNNFLHFDKNRTVDSYLLTMFEL